MDGLPPLRSEGPNIGNALLLGERIKQSRKEEETARARNALLERRTQLDEATLNFQKESQAISNLFKTLELAMDAKTPQLARQILDTGLGERAKNFDLSRQGDTITITMSDKSEMSGPVGVMKELAGAIRMNPERMANPQDAAHTIAWAAANGINFKQAPEESKILKPGEHLVTSKGEELASVPALKTAEETKRYVLKPGEKLVDNQGNVKASVEKDEKEKRIILKRGESIVDENNKIVVTAPDPTEADKKRLEKVKKAQALVLSLSKEGKINPLVATLLAATPDLANDPEVRAQMSAGIKPELKPYYERALDILAGYYGVKEAPTITKPSPKITHKFTREKGFEVYEPLADMYP